MGAIRALLHMLDAVLVHSFPEKPCMQDSVILFYSPMKRVVVGSEYGRYHVSRHHNLCTGLWVEFNRRSIVV